MDRARMDGRGTEKRLEDRLGWMMRRQGRLEREQD